MSALSNYLENKILDHVLGTASYTMPAQVYLALFTADPGETGAAGEVEGNGYARLPADFNAASGGTADNEGDLTFARANGGDWGTITHWALFDALTSGNMLIHGAWNSSRSIPNGDQFVAEDGALDVSAD